MIRRSEEKVEIANVYPSLRTQQAGTATSATSTARAAKTRHQPRSAKSSRRCENEMKWGKIRAFIHLGVVLLTMLYYTMLYE